MALERSVCARAGVETIGVQDLACVAAILAIAARHGVQRVRVFGSFARGEANEESDLDLLNEAGPHTPPWFPGGLLADLEEELGRSVDVAEAYFGRRLLGNKPRTRPGNCLGPSASAGGADECNLA